MFTIIRQNMRYFNAGFFETLKIMRQYRLMVKYAERAEQRRDFNQRVGAY